MRFRDVRARGRARSGAGQVRGWAGVLAAAGFAAIGSPGSGWAQTWAPDFPAPAHQATNVPVSLRLQWSYSTVNVVSNGGFETRSFAGWSNGPAAPLWAINPATRPWPGYDEPAPAPASGRYNARARFTGGGSAALRQEMALPADLGRAVLNWSARSHYALSATGGLRPDFQVTCTGADGAARTLFSVVNGDRLGYRWERFSRGLEEWAGQTVRLAFIARGGSSTTEIHLDDVELLVAWPVAAVFEVFLGTNNPPAAGDRLGATTNTSWQVTGLRPNTVYYWQVAAREGGEGGETRTGPVWRFLTGPAGPLDHFDLTLPAEEATLNVPLALTVTARDRAENLVTNVAGPVRVAATTAGGLVPRLLLSELAIAGPVVGSLDYAEIQNVTTNLLELPQVRLTFYDATKWPAPAGALTVTNLRLQAGATLTVREGSAGSGALGLGVSLNWAYQTARGQTAAVLLQDETGAALDFVCVGGAYPAQINQPFPIPLAEWLGRPLAAKATASGLTWQRVSDRDNNRDEDWDLRSTTLGLENPALWRPLLPG